MRVQKIKKELDVSGLKIYVPSIVLNYQDNFIYNEGLDKGSIIKSDGYEVVSEFYFNINFLDVIHDFVNNSLTEIKEIEEEKIKIVQKILNKNILEIEELRNQITLIDFFNKLLERDFDQYLGSTFCDDLILKYNNAKKAYSSKSMFKLKFKDSDGNVFLSTEAINPIDVLKNYAFSLTLYLDDETISGKHGFYSGEKVYIYYHNVFQNIDFQIRPGITLSNQAILNAGELSISDLDNNKLNNIYLKIRSNNYIY